MDAASSWRTSSTPRGSNAARAGAGSSRICALLVYHYEGRHGWLGDDLYYALVGPDERLPVLALHDTELTIEGYQGPLTYHRIESDPAFTSGLD